MKNTNREKTNKAKTAFDISLDINSFLLFLGCNLSCIIINLYLNSKNKT